jgi:membrane protein implicated in regulation of membrane protease activity
MLPPSAAWLAVPVIITCAIVLLSVILFIAISCWKRFYARRA